MRNSRNQPSPRRGNGRGRRNNSNKKVIIGVIIALAVIIAIFAFSNMSKPHYLPLQNQVVQSVNSDGTIKLNNGLTVEILGITPNAKTIEFLQNNLVGKTVNIIADSHDTKAYYKDPSKDKVRGYINVVGGANFTNLNSYLIKNKLADLNPSFCQDSLNNFRKSLTANASGQEIPGSNSANKTYDKKSLFQYMAPATLYIEATDGEQSWCGTAFFINENGLAVTNYHVLPPDKVAGAQVYLCDENGKTSRDRVRGISRVLAADSENDWCIFVVTLDPSEKSPYLNLAKKEPDHGDEICVVGNPKGIVCSSTYGSVSNIIPEVGKIQIDANMTHGNSGGPVCNFHGEVIGIAQMVMADEAGNLNFATDIQLVRKALDKMKDVRFYGGK